MTAFAHVEAVMVLVSGHGQKILVVVEIGLGVQERADREYIVSVLILVVVELGLGDWLNSHHFDYRGS